MTQVKINRNDWTASGEGRNELYFLTGQFADGTLLGFWSHSPWGRVHDMEQGWVAISPKGEVLSECETRMSGHSVWSFNGGWRAWVKQLKTDHGKLKKLGEKNWDGRFEPYWKITEN